MACHRLKHSGFLEHLQGCQASSSTLWLLKVTMQAGGPGKVASHSHSHT